MVTKRDNVAKKIIAGSSPSRRRKKNLVSFQEQPGEEKASAGEGSNLSRSHSSFASSASSRMSPSTAIKKKSQKKA
jgi:hypothetical protein